MDDVKETITKILQNLLMVDDVRPEHSMVSDLGADSLDSVEIIMDIETAFNIEITDKAAEKLKTVQDLINYVEQAEVKA